jgi:lipopolysaccharide export system ATP-binding protein
MALLEVRGLEKWYGRRQVVKGVDYDVEPGEVVGLLGPNGAGKTTSFRMTIGLIDADAGSVFFNGNNISKLPMFRRARLGLGYLPQEASVFKQLSVENNLMAILETLPGLSRQERKKRQDKLLDQFGLTHVRKTMANRVSGGERRRVEIARSLVTEPKLIMLDEPFAAIDPKTVSEIQDVIRDLAKTYKIGILLTDHSVERVLESSDRSYLIHDGRVVVSGTSLQILESAQAREVYLGNRIDYAHLLENRHVHALGGETHPEMTATSGPIALRPEMMQDLMKERITVTGGDPEVAPGRILEIEARPGVSASAPNKSETVTPVMSRDRHGYRGALEIPDDLALPPEQTIDAPIQDFDLDTILGGSVTISGDVVIEHVNVASNDPPPPPPPQPRKSQESRTS